MAVKFLLGLGTARPNVMSLVYSTSRLARLFEGRVRPVNRFHVLTKAKKYPVSGDVAYLAAQSEAEWHLSRVDATQLFGIDDLT